MRRLWGAASGKWLQTSPALSKSSNHVRIYEEVWVYNTPFTSKPGAEDSKHLQYAWAACNHESGRFALAATCGHMLCGHAPRGRWTLLRHASAFGLSTLGCTLLVSHCALTICPHAVAASKGGAVRLVRAMVTRAARGRWEDVGSEALEDPVPRALQPLSRLPQAIWRHLLRERLSPCQTK